MRLKTKKKLISSIPTPGVLNWIPPPLLLLKTALFGLKQVLSNFYAIGFL
jgi:hypothetical protein